jgi:hypothetical protein
MSRKFRRGRLVKYAVSIDWIGPAVCRFSRFGAPKMHIVNKKFLDIDASIGVIHKTWKTAFALAVRHDFDQAQTALPCTSRARARQPGGQRRAGRALPRQRLLRAGGPSPSALRDAPKRAREGAIREFSRDPLRRLACHVLPSAGCLRARRRGGIGSAQERTTGRSQVDGRGAGLRLGSTAGRSRTQLDSTSGAGEGAVQRVGTSSQHRAGSRAAEKKRAAATPEIADALRRQNKALLISSYERIRAQATKSASTDDSIGQDLFCQRGFAAWLADLRCVSGSGRVASVAPMLPLQGNSDPVFADEAGNALACLVASMIQPLLFTGVTS